MDALTPQKAIYGLWAKSEPRQSLQGHMLIVGIVCKELLTDSAFSPSLSLLTKMLDVSQEQAIAHKHDGTALNNHFFKLPFKAPERIFNWVSPK